MTRLDSRRVLRAAALAATVAGLILLVPVYARAQLGSLVKKATEKATEKATGQETGTAPRPIGTELTDDVISRMIKGLTVTESKLGQRDELAKRAQAVSEQVSAIESREDGAIRGYQAIQDRWDACRSDQFDKVSDEHRKTTEALGTSLQNDPAKLSAWMATQQKFAMTYAMAMQKGDTAAIRKARDDMNNAAATAAGIDLKADTAKVQRLCGGAPARPAAVAQLDSLRALHEDLTKQIRTLEEQAQEQGATAAGMNLVEYGTAREKFVSFKAKAKGQLTTAEVQRLRAREAEWGQFKRAL